MSKSVWENRIVGHDEVRPEDLLAHPKNYRIHPKSQQDVLAGAIKDVGFIRSVTVSKNSGFVIDGHLRVALAISAGQDSLPVEYVDLSEAEEAEALAVLDPIAALAATDHEQLGALMADIENADEAVLEMLSELHEVEVPVGNAEPDDVPEPPEEPITKRGDVWLLGEHRVMCGDSKVASEVDELLNGRTADMLHIDPPYGINVVAVGKDGLGAIGGSKPFGSTSGTARKSSTVEAGAARRGYVGGGEPASQKIIQSNTYPVIHGDDTPFEPAEFLDRAPLTIMWGANYYADKLPPSSRWICWDKREDITRNTFADCELAWCSKHGPARVFHHLWNGLHKGSQHNEKRTHPTEKPVALFEEIGKMFCPNGLWLDLFAGTGAQLIAAERAGATCYAMEYEQAYTDVICRRYQEYTGTLPVLEFTGEEHDFTASE